MIILSYHHLRDYRSIFNPKRKLLMSTCYANGMQKRVLSIAKCVDGTELDRRILFLSRVGNETKSKLVPGA